jgi:hypothetical protein
MVAATNDAGAMAAAAAHYTSGGGVFALMRCRIA